MATVSFTHRIDPSLKSDLDEIARSENRSTSNLANHAIKSFVESRKATRELVETGLSLVKAGAPSISADDMHKWLLADEEQPFPKGEAISSSF